MGVRGMQWDTISFIQARLQKKYQLTLEEKRFLFRLTSGLREARKDTKLQVRRMADGTLSVSSHRAYLGKIKLQGKKTWMQYPVNLYDVREAEDKTLEEYSQLLKYWVKFA